jgi:two-component system sporulation sensor kinase A
MISLTLSPIRDGSGRVIGTAAIGRDVTEQKAIQAQLYRAQRLESLATLAAGVAHQFNNINTVVGGYLQMLQMEKRLPARAAGYVEAARTAVQRAIDITDRLLALTGSAAGSTDTLRFEDLARAVLPLYEPRIEAEKVRIVLNLAETPPIRGDESRLRFVLSSLLGNALDALLDRPVRMASIRTGSTKDTAYFEIEDSGCGIPELDMPRIFSPFYSAKGEWAPTGSPQAKLRGVGLSLAISSTTISEYGGRIDVQSTAGAGSTFRVVMPLSRPGS